MVRFINRRYLQWLSLLFLLFVATCRHPPPLDPATIDVYSLELLPSINMDREGKLHEVTEVPFKRLATQREPNGKYYAIVVPIFDFVYEFVFPEDLYLECDKVQFHYLNQKLKLAVEEDPDLASVFTPMQLAQIKAGNKPKGYTWHHDVPMGVMRLVLTDTHSKTGHTGGRWVWGGGHSARYDCKKE